MFGFIAAKRNLALTTEKNDFLIFLGSNFLSIGEIPSLTLSFATPISCAFHAKLEKRGM